MSALGVVRPRGKDLFILVAVLTFGLALTCLAYGYACDQRTESRLRWLNADQALGFSGSAWAEQMPELVLLGGVFGTLMSGAYLLYRRTERRRRRRLEEERRAEERRFHEVVENMAGAVTVFIAMDQATTFSVWDMNAAALALANPGIGAPIGRPLAEVFGAELHGQVHEAMRRVWASGRAEKLPPFPYGRDGRVRWLGCNVFRLGAGEIVTVFNDITAQKEIEQELRQARAELELALDASRVGLWSWDRALECLRIDARTGAILDVGSTSTLRFTDLTERMEPHDVARLRGEVEQAIGQLREFETEIRLVTRNGEARHLCVRARPTAGPDGAMRHVVGCVWDVTRRRKLEENQQQQRRLESITTLAGGIAHDLNNALAPLSMGLDLLRLRAGNDPESAETLQSMAGSVRRAAAVVKQLSGLVRSAADISVTSQPRRVLDVLRVQLRDTLPPGITADVREPAADLPAVQAGARQLHQVLQNICVNAREVMRGHGTLTVSAELRAMRTAERTLRPDLAEGDYVAFVVQDTGPGIPEEIRGRIFDPFFTTKETGRGMGLGLSTALSIVRACRGTILCDTRVGEGTSFSVLIPVSREHRLVDPFTAGSAGKVGVGATLRGKTVLLADDETMVRELARRVLETAGMKVHLAKDGREAIGIFTRQPAAFDLVVLDFVMPEMDGPTAGTEIRRIRPDVPILGASGFAGEPALRQSRAAGFTALLPKPYTMDGLLDAIRAALRAPVSPG